MLTRHISGPWTNNCIGHYNYPDFLRFLFYVDCACGYHLYLITTVAFGDTFHMRDPTASWIVWLVINYTLSVVLHPLFGRLSHNFWCPLADLYPSCSLLGASLYTISTCS